MDNNFKKLRLQYRPNGKPVSQRGLAKVLNVAASHISELENGRTPSLSELKAYHVFFHVSYEYLLGETESLVSSDIFREKPIIESTTENTIRWLNESNDPDEIDVRNTFQYLLGESRGLLLLFYINAYRMQTCSLECLCKCIEELQDDKYSNYTFKELQIMMKNKFDMI